MVTTRLQKIENALQRNGCKFTKNGDSLQAQCPAHDDKNPSLSVMENDDGKILMKCHAGCDTKKVIKELGLNIEALFPVDSLEGGKNRIVASYDYTDKNGKCFIRPCGFIPKSFASASRRRVVIGNGT
jgi:hypothetical protein